MGIKSSVRRRLNDALPVRVCSMRTTCTAWWNIYHHGKTC